MRSINSTITNNLHLPKEVSGKILVEDGVSSFTYQALTETSYPAGANPVPLDMCVLQGTPDVIYRVIVFGTNVYYSKFNAGATSTTWSTVSACDANTSACLSRISGVVTAYYVRAGSLYKRTITSSVGTETLVKSNLLGTKQKIATSTYEETNVLSALYYDSTNKVWRLSYVNGSSELTDPYAIKDEDGTKIAKIARIKEVNNWYVLIPTEDGKSYKIKMSIVKRRGEIEPIIPMDIVDSMTFFKVGNGVTNGSFIHLFGRMSRESLDSPMQVMFSTEVSTWADHFSSSRDMYIGSEGTIPACGGPGTSKIFAATVGGYWQANYTRAWNWGQAFSPVTYTGVEQIRMEAEPNSSSKYNITLPAATAALIKGGDVIEVRIVVNGTEATIGYMGVDGLASETTVDAESASVTGRGLALKRLSQWTSDNDYDYWSQTKQTASPMLLSELVRIGGAFEEHASGYLYLTKMNEAGFLYSVQRGSHNGVARAKFYVPSNAAFNGEVGVLVNFRRETKSDAVDRGSVAADDGRYHNGVAAIVSSKDATLYLYEITDSVYTQKSTAPFTVIRDTYFWIELELMNGIAIVRYRSDADVLWSSALSSGVVGYDTVNAPGKPGLYFKNVTQTFETVGFSTSDTIIPLISQNGVSYTDETIVVDSEIIRVKTAGANYTGLTDMTMITPVTFPQAVHNNAYFQSGDLVSITDPVTPADQPISTNNTPNTANAFLGSSFTLYTKTTIRGGRVHVKKVGNPTTPLYIWVANDGIDNDDSGPQLPSVFTYTSIAAASVGTSYSELSFTFPTPWLVDPANYWFIYTTCIPGNSPVIDTNNYYVIKITTEGRYLPGIIRLSGQGDPQPWWVRNPDGLAVFTVVGDGHAMGKGYPIYFDGIGPAQARTYYNDMALVITSGPGKGRVFKITDYDYYAPDIWLPSRQYIYPDKWENHVGDAAHGAWTASSARRIFVSEDPKGAIQAGATAKIMPAFHVLQRGYNSTVATSHFPASGNLRISLWRDLSVRATVFEWGSSEMDMSFESMAKEIAGKAGVLIDAEKDHNGSFANSTTSIATRNAVNTIVQAKQSNTSSIGLAFRCTSGWVGKFVEITHASDVTFGTYNNGVKTNQQIHYDTLVDVNEPTTISVFDKFVSVWQASRLVAFFVTNDTTTNTYNRLFSSSATGNMTVDWPELDLRVDNFIGESGARGAQMLSRLVGEKHYFFQDDQNGKLRLFRNRTAVSGTQTRFMQVGEVTDETGLATRVRVEGGGVKEVYNAADLSQYGNLYALVNLGEVENDADAAREAAYILDDVKKRSTIKTITGPMDPRLEPNDQISATLNGATANYAIDRIGLVVATSQDAVAFDMSMEVHSA